MFSGIRRPRVDVPEFTRCCICLPLRYGLLAWGYSKMIGLSVILYTLSYIISQMKKYKHDVPSSLVLFLIVVIVDLICSVFLIVGGHLKHRLLYKMYYYYSICFLIAFVLIFVGNTIDDLVESGDKPGKADFHYVIMYMVSCLYLCTPILVIQLYVTMMVRSELVKLSNPNLQFVNHAAEATGSLNGLTAPTA